MDPVYSYSPQPVGRKQSNLQCAYAMSGVAPEYPTSCRVTLANGVISMLSYAQYDGRLVSFSGSEFP